MEAAAGTTSPEYRWLQRAARVLGSLFLIAILLYAGAQVYLRIEARRTAYFLKALSSIQIGQPAASVKGFVTTYERQVYRVEGPGEITYFVEADPLPLRALRPDWLAADVSDFLLRTGDWRRNSGLRFWRAVGTLRVKADLVEYTWASLAVEGENEWLMGNWDYRDSFSPDFVRVRGIPVTGNLESRSYFANWAHLHMGSETGEVFENHLTSAATAEQLSAARDFNLACLRSRKGCRSLCELMPSAAAYGRRHNSLSLGWNSGSWGQQTDESCH